MSEEGPEYLRLHLIDQIAGRLADGNVLFDHRAIAISAVGSFVDWLREADLWGQTGNGYWWDGLADLLDTDEQD